MDWTEIKISVPAAKTDETTAIANMVVPYGVYIEDYSDLEEQAPMISHVGLIDEELLSKDRDKAVVHIYMEPSDNVTEAVAFLTERLSANGIENEIISDNVKDADWAENWKKYFKSFEIGKRIAVCPSWEEYNNTDGRHVLKIDPGAAFGTGTHATTSLCLEMLDKYIMNDMTVLDVGCGSGILAIASVLLGGRSSVGVDIDGQSVKVAAENAEINGISDKAEFIEGDLAEKISGKFDVVCANIVADVIMRLAKDVNKYMKDDSLFICSGIIDIRADEVRECLLSQNFEITDERRKDNWYAFAVRKVKQYA